MVTVPSGWAGAHVHLGPTVYAQVLTHPARQGPVGADPVTEARRSPSVVGWSRGVRGLWAAALSHLGTCRDLQFLQLLASLSTATPIPSDRQTDRQTGFLAELT